MIAAIVVCSAMLFTACTKEDNPGGTGSSGIAMIVKDGQIDYWRQIETAFRDACQEKGLEAYYYATSAEKAYEEQLAAVEELRKLDNNQLKGIIFAPSYGQNGESAEAEVAALARERGIPVVSALGTGNKRDAQQLRLDDISKTFGCTFARVIRKELRDRGVTHHPVVFSPEVPMKPAQFEAPPPGRRAVPGSLVWVPASAGMLLCQYVVTELCGLQ